MGSRLALVTQTFKPSENHTWLGSAHGTSEAEPITLEGDTFLTDFTDGVIPSGVVLGQITASTLYVQYANGGTDGEETAKGHLFTTVDLGGTDAAVVGNVSAALYWHGRVIEANLPTDHGLDANAKTDLKHIRYV